MSKNIKEVKQNIVKVESIGQTDNPTNPVKEFLTSNPNPKKTIGDLSDTEIKALICDWRDKLDLANYSIGVLRKELERRYQPKESVTKSK